MAIAISVDVDRGYGVTLMGGISRLRISLFNNELLDEEELLPLPLAGDLGDSTERFGLPAAYKHHISIWLENNQQMHLSRHNYDSPSFS